MCKRSLSAYRAWCDELREITGIDVEYRDEGCLLVAADEDEARLLASAAEEYRTAGLATEVLSPDEVHRLEPMLTPQCRGALFLPDDHQVHTRRLVEAARIAVEAAGVSVASATAVRAVRSQRNRVSGVVTAAGDVAAPAVVLAAGAWCPELADGVHIPDLPIRPVKGEIVAVSMGHRNLRHSVHGTQCYLVPRHDGRLLVGATEVEGNYDTRVTARAVAQLLAAGERLVPAIGESAIHEMWAGLRPTAPDRLPILGPAGPDGLLLATGHYRKGIVLAPETARLLAHTIVHKHAPPELEPFQLARFAARAA
jgi:glycine oxidase